MYFMGVSVSLNILYLIYWIHSAMSLSCQTKAVLGKKKGS